MEIEERRRITKEEFVKILDTPFRDVCKLLSQNPFHILNKFIMCDICPIHDTLEDCGYCGDEFKKYLRKRGVKWKK